MNNQIMCVFMYVCLGVFLFMYVYALLFISVFYMLFHICVYAYVDVLKTHGYIPVSAQPFLL